MLHTPLPWHIRGDLHVHASHSACDQHKPGDPVDYQKTCGGFAIAEMREYLQIHNFEYLAMVNHATDPSRPQVPTPHSEKKVKEHRRTVLEIEAQTQDKHPKLLSGVETSVIEDGVDVTTVTLCSLDVVIVSRHGESTSWSMDATIRALMKVFAQEPVHILGHPTRYVPPQPLAAYRRLLDLCKEWNVAFELNLRNPFGQELIGEIVESGVLLSLGSDIHREAMKQPPTAFDTALNIPVFHQLSEAGFPAERVLNTWPLSQLQQWLAEKKTMCDNIN